MTRWLQPRVGDRVQKSEHLPIIFIGPCPRFTAFLLLRLLLLCFRQLEVIFGLFIAVEAVTLGINFFQVLTKCGDAKCVEIIFKVVTPGHLPSGRPISRSTRWSKAWSFPRCRRERSQLPWALWVGGGAWRAGWCVGGG